MSNLTKEFKFENNGTIVSYRFGGGYETSNVKILKDNGNYDPVIDETIKILIDLENAGFSLDVVFQLHLVILKALGALSKPDKTSYNSYIKARDFIRKVELMIKAPELVSEALQEESCNKEFREAGVLFLKEQNYSNYVAIKRFL